MGGVAQEVEDTEVRNIAMIDKKKFKNFLKTQITQLIPVNKLTHLSVTNST